MPNRLPATFHRLRPLLALLLGLLGACQPAVKRNAAARGGRVVRLFPPNSPAALQVCGPKGSSCAQAALDRALPSGSTLRTFARSSAAIALSDGTSLLLDHDTVVELASAARAAHLDHGSLIIDVPHMAQKTMRFELNLGAVELAYGKFALRAGSDFATLSVLRGSATVHDRDGATARIAAGEQARLDREGLALSSGAALAQAAAFADRLAGDTAEGSTELGLGELVARKPGSPDELRSVVSLAAHRVRVRIAGAMARTEVDEVFENSSNEVLEGVYRFAIPSGAQIERLALEVDGQLQEGAFVDRDRGRAIWQGAIAEATPWQKPPPDQIVWVKGPWRDPALLEWQRGGNFELKIFPIPKHGRRRVVLAYTEAAHANAGIRHYTYPLAVDPGGTTKIRHFDLDIEVRGQDPRFGVQSVGYPLERRQIGEAIALRFSADDFSPSGALELDWTLPDRRSEVSAFGYRSGGERYALFDLRPNLPRVSADRVHATAIVIDSSRSMFGESFERAKRLALRVAGELDPNGALFVLACDSACREFAPELVAPGPETTHRISDFLRSLSADGASDPTQAIALAERALAASAGAQVRDIIYIGDGAATVGPIRVATVSAAVRETLHDSRSRVTSVAIGTNSDLETLGALARGGGGVVVPYTPGSSVGEAARAVLAATYGSALRDVEVVLPAGLHAIAPARLDTILAGSETSLGAVMDSDTVDGTLELRGTLDGAPFEQRYAVHVQASDSPGNAFVPRRYAAVRIVDLERIDSVAAKNEALALSTRFGVASRYSSLLVLESEAMLHAFGLSKSATDSFSGETLADASEASGRVPLDEPEPAAELAAPSPSSADALDKQSSSFAAPSAAARPGRAPALMPRARSEGGGDEDERFAEPPPPAKSRRLPLAQPLSPVVDPEPRPRWIAMRRVWERKGRINDGEHVAQAVGVFAISEAERALAAEPERRSVLKKLYSLYALNGELSRAEGLVEHWLSKEPLSAEALTARADLAARRGQRDLSLRLLGSVIDVRPDDIAAQRRLARLYRWSGRPELGCRHAIAVAELRAGDAQLLAAALRCARSGANAHWASDALALSAEKTARLAETLAASPAPDDSRLLGDLRVEAQWSEAADLDLAILHPDGHRVSWLGANTREPIAARDVLSLEREGLALNGAKPGIYAIEVVRNGAATYPVHGELTLNVAGETRRIPFHLDGQRETVAWVEIRMVPRLIPLQSASLAIDNAPLP